MFFKFASAAALFHVGMSQSVGHYIPATAETCAVFGDPHLEPFGTKVTQNVQSEGTHTYVHGADGNLVIQARSATCNHNWIAPPCIDQVTVQFCGLRFKIDLEGDEVWEEIRDDAEGDGAVELPNGYSVVSFHHEGKNYSLLSLPDNSKIQVGTFVKRRSWVRHYDFTVELPTRYNSATKGLCGFKNSSEVIVDELITGYGVTEAADCIANSAYTGEAFGPWGEMADTSYTCPDITRLKEVDESEAILDEDETTVIVPTSEAESEPLVAAEETSEETPTREQEERTNELRVECQTEASAKMAEYPTCTLDFADAIEACALDMLTLNLSFNETNLASTIKDECEEPLTDKEPTEEAEPPANCHIRRRT